MVSSVASRSVQRAQRLSAFFGALAMLFFMVVLLDMALRAATLPTVYESWKTQHCVKVDDPLGGNYDCVNLPEKYNHVWVE